MLTIIIPSHRRHRYLRRSIAYYQQLPFQVLLVDSSTNAFNDPLPAHIRYLHLPDMPFADKVLIAANHLETPFVALCPDDDFFLPQLLQQATAQMSQNPDLSICFGRPIRFDEPYSGRFRWAGAALPFPRLSGDKILDIQRFMKRYEQVLWSVYRPDVLFESFVRIRQARYQNENFIELTIAAVAVALGTIHPMSGPWMVRETAIGEHWGKLHETIGWQHQVDIDLFKAQLADLVCEDYAELALQAYINRFVAGGLIQRYRRFRKHVLKNHPTSAAPKVEGDLCRVDAVLSGEYEQA